MKAIFYLFLLSLLISGCEILDFDSSLTNSDILFISRRTENSSDWSLMVMNSDGSNQRYVTELTTRCEKPVVSNSGKTILFVHNTEDYFYELYSVDVEGTNLELIDRGNRYCGSPCWAQNDSKIIYSINRNDSTDDKDLILYDVSTKEKRKLTSEGSNSSAKFSTNNKIVYCHRDDTYISNISNIYTMDIDGNNKKLIIERACNPNWSPNGEKIIYQSSGENGSSQIFTANSDGSNQKRLTSTYSSRIWPGYPPDGNTEPTCTPDGKKIVYVSWEDEDPEIYIMNFDGSNKKKLTNTDTRDENPVVTKNGKQILFVSRRNSNFDPEIFVMDINGNNQKPLSNYEGSDIYPIEI